LLFEGWQKNHLRGRNNPSTLSLTGTRRVSPPAPHPQSPGVEPRPSGWGSFFSGPKSSG
jgi:hypothetical protein